MGLMSRTKGKSGEREVVDLLQPVLTKVAVERGIDPARLVIQRNTVQSDRGGTDLCGLPGLAVEVKRCETLAVDQWWSQCCRQAYGDEALGAWGLPVLFYRKNQAKWRVRMFGHCGGNLWKGGPVQPLSRAVVEVSVADFLVWFERWCDRYLCDYLEKHPTHACPRGGGRC